MFCGLNANPKWLLSGFESSNHLHVYAVEDVTGTYANIQSLKPAHCGFL